MEKFENANVENIEEQVAGTNWQRELFEWVKVIVVAVVIAVLLKTFVMTLARVDGRSMEPTLHHADRMYINKLFYKPERGDVVIIKSKRTNEKFWIKRVIAVEGDTLFIDFTNGDVYVNDEIIDEPYIKEPTLSFGNYVNRLLSNGEFTRQNPLTIPEGEVFVMGDNRNNSSDSRAIGPVAVEDVEGHAVFRFWPLNQMGNFDHSFKD
jgi:signal peptidase I